MELAPQQLIDLAVRLAAYPGVVTARIRIEQHGNAVLPDGARIVDATEAGIAGDPTLSSIIDFG